MSAVNGVNYRPGSSGDHRIPVTGGDSSGEQLKPSSPQFKPGSNGPLTNHIPPENAFHG